MSMCYLCDLCRHKAYKSWTGVDYMLICRASRATKPKAIDYGAQDPMEVCADYEPRGDAE